MLCDVEKKEKGGSSHHKVYQESKSNRTEAKKVVSYIYIYIATCIYNLVMQNVIICRLRSLLYYNKRLNRASKKTQVLLSSLLTKPKKTDGKYSEGEEVKCDSVYY